MVSGLEALGTVAAASQLAEQALEIISMVSELYIKIRDAPESMRKDAAQIQQLVDIAGLIKQTNSLQTAVVDSILRVCVSEATEAKRILEKACIAVGEGHVKKLWRAVFGLTKEKAILAHFARLEQGKSTLTLCIATIDSGLLRTIHLELAAVKVSMDDVSKDLLEIKDIDRNITMLIELIPGIDAQVTNIHGLISGFASMVETVYDELPDVAQVTTNSDKMLSEIRDAMEACQIRQTQTEANDQAKKIRLWLGPSDFEGEQKRRQKVRVAGTNLWFLKHPSFKIWSNTQFTANGSRLLWAYGKPGCGKSILASSVVLELQKLGFQPLYFFFNSKSCVNIDSTPLGLIRTVLFQISLANPPLLDLLYPLYAKSGQSEPIFCVIDALDEAINSVEEPICGRTDTNEFLAALTDTMHHCQMLRVCIISRPNHKIARQFFPADDLDKDAADFGNSPSANELLVIGRDHLFPVLINEHLVYSDLAEYVRTQINICRKLKSWMNQDSIELLTMRAEGMFLWVRLMVDELRKASTPKALGRQLNESPKGLSDLYTLIIQRLFQTLNKDQLELCRNILKWVIAAKTRLTVSQLSACLAIQDGQKKFSDEDMMFDPEHEIMAVCTPLVEILDDKTIQLVHLSVKDFLLDSLQQDVKASFGFSRDLVNAELGISLLTFLQFDDFSASRISDFFKQQIQDGVDQSHIYELLQYGLLNWHLHCYESGNAENAQKLHKFVLDYLTSDHCFLWMENLASYRMSSDWIFIESQLVKWSMALNVEKKETLKTAFILELANRRFVRLQMDLNESDPDAVRAMANLASIYRHQGQWKEAEELEIQVVETRKRVLGQEHPGTLTGMGNLALTYWIQGRWKEAEELGVRVVETRKRVLGQEHPGTLTSMDNLALTYRNQGRWKEAEELGVQVVETSKRVLGQEYPDTLTSMNNLASTYRNQGRWKEAEELGVQVVETSKRVLGQEHPDTLTSMGNLALTYWNQGRWKEAEELGVQAMETSKRVLGQEHPGTLTSMSNLALTYWNLGQWKEAEELEVQVVEKSKRVLGQEHPDTLTSINNLAWTWSYQGRRDEAVKLMTQCVQGLERKLGIGHPHTKASLDTLNKWQDREKF